MMMSFCFFIRNAQQQQQQAPAFLLFLAHHLLLFDVAPPSSCFIIREEVLYFLGGTFCHCLNARAMLTESTLGKNVLYACLIFVVGVAGGGLALWVGRDYARAKDEGEDVGTGEEYQSGVSC